MEWNAGTVPPYKVSRLSTRLSASSRRLAGPRTVSSVRDQQPCRCRDMGTVTPRHAVARRNHHAAGPAH
jgi:hypothetical protein